MAVRVGVGVALGVAVGVTDGVALGLAVGVGVGVLPIMIWTTPCCAPIGFLCADLERTTYAQEKPNEAERDAELQFIWFNKSTPPKMWQLYT